MRIGLIGLGRIGVFHAATLSRHDQVDQLVVTDAVPGMAEAATTEFLAACRPGTRPWPASTSSRNDAGGDG